MAHKYYRYTLEGKVDAHDAARALGEAAADGVIVRVDSRDARTEVTVARSGDTQPKGDRGVEVSEKDLLNFGGGK